MQIINCKNEQDAKNDIENIVIFSNIPIVIYDKYEQDNKVMRIIKQIESSINEMRRKFFIVKTTEIIHPDLNHIYYVKTLDCINARINDNYYLFDLNYRDL